jgi:hypothetical protein
MHFWIAYAIVVGAWWWLYSFVSDMMTGLGIGWMNAMNPQIKAQSTCLHVSSCKQNSLGLS